MSKIQYTTNEVKLKVSTDATTLSTTSAPVLLLVTNKEDIKLAIVSKETVLIETTS